MPVLHKVCLTRILLFIFSISCYIAAVTGDRLTALEDRHTVDHLDTVEQVPLKRGWAVSLSLFEGL